MPPGQRPPRHIRPQHTKASAMAASVASEKIRQQKVVDERKSNSPIAKNNIDDVQTRARDKRKIAGIQQRGNAISPKPVQRPSSVAGPTRQQQTASPRHQQQRQNNAPLLGHQAHHVSIQPERKPPAGRQQMRIGHQASHVSTQPPRALPAGHQQDAHQRHNNAMLIGHQASHVTIQPPRMVPGELQLLSPGAQNDMLIGHQASHASIQPVGPETLNDMLIGHQASHVSTQPSRALSAGHQQYDQQSIQPQHQQMTTHEQQPKQGPNLYSNNRYSSDKASSNALPAAGNKSISYHQWKDGANQQASHSGNSPDQVSSRVDLIATNNDFDDVKPHHLKSIKMKADQKTSEMKLKGTPRELSDVKNSRQQGEKDGGIKGASTGSAKYRASVESPKPSAGHLRQTPSQDTTRQASTKSTNSLKQKGDREVVVTSNGSSAHSESLSITIKSGPSEETSKSDLKKDGDVGKGNTAVSDDISPKQKPQTKPQPSKPEMGNDRNKVPANKKPKPNTNLEFYQNKARSQPLPGNTIEEMLKWKGNYQTLERNHQYIQWLFPITESSGMNRSAQALQPNEAQAIVADPKAKKRVQRAYMMMLDFYGMELLDTKTGEVGRCSNNWKDRYTHLNKSKHNYLRITRIIKCLGQLGFEHFQAPWVSFLMHEILSSGHMDNMRNTSAIQYWIAAVDDEQAKLDLYATHGQLFGDMKVREEDLGNSEDEADDTEN